MVLARRAPVRCVDGKHMFSVHFEMIAKSTQKSSILLYEKHCRIGWPCQDQSDMVFRHPLKSLMLQFRTVRYFGPCGAPFAPAPSGGPAKRRGQTPAKQPEGRGATRSRPLPASMASGVDRIAAPGGTFAHGASGTVAGGLRAPQTPARYLNKKISRSFDGFLSPQTDRSFEAPAL